MIDRRFLGLLFALLLPAPAPAEVPPPTVTIALDSFAYTPNPIRLAADRPVRLHFVNRSGKGHDFTARQFFARARILAGSAPGGEIELAGRQSATVDLVPSAGRYKVHCGHFMHKAMGMKADILVD